MTRDKRGSPPDSPNDETRGVDDADPYDRPGEALDLKGRTRTQRIVHRIERTLLLSVLLLAVVVGGGGYWGWTQFTQPGPLEEARSVVVPQGAGVRAIAGRLAAADVIVQPEVFILAARATGQHAKLKAGEFAFEPGMSQRAVLAKLVSGETVDRFITVPEGLTSAEIVALLRADEALSGAIETTPEEGTLLPETYHYELDAPREDLIRRMRGAMDAALAELWEARAPNLPFDAPRDAVTLASIVEKETGVAGERSMVAGVFVNRLRRGMRLQSDPTVVYALMEGAGPLDRALTRQDWKVEHPYNTYRVDGLPPGPIANPGRAALAAVLDPAETEALYFVADGTGGHAFARTLDEHNRNVAKWRRIRDAAKDPGE